MTNKTLEQIQKENRKAIIMSCNPEAKSYKEALEMELKKLTDTPAKKYILNGDEVFFINYELDDPYDWMEYMSSVDSFEKQIMTLNQVLIAWAYKIAKLEPSRFDHHKLRFFLLPDHEYLCEWDLTKETLEEQSEDTQKRINDLLNI